MNFPKAIDVSHMDIRCEGEKVKKIEFRHGKLLGDDPILRAEGEEDRLIMVWRLQDGGSWEHPVAFEDLK